MYKAVQNNQYPATSAPGRTEVRDKIIIRPENALGGLFSTPRWPSDDYPIELNGYLSRQEYTEIMEAMNAFYEAYAAKMRKVVIPLFIFVLLAFLAMFVLPVVAMGFMFLGFMGGETGAIISSTIGFVGIAVAFIVPMILVFVAAIIVAVITNKRKAALKEQYRAYINQLNGMFEQKGMSWKLGFDTLITVTHYVNSGRRSMNQTNLWNLEITFFDIVPHV